MARVRIPRASIVAAMQSKETRAALEEKARKVASRVGSLGASEGVTMNARVESGTRPKGRPYSNVVSDNVSQEWGDRWTERRRILGRVAEELTTRKRGG